MPIDISSTSRSGFSRTGGFTFAGVITGLAATMTALVLGVFVTTRLAQRGVHQAESAIAGLKSSIAGTLDDLGTQAPSEPAAPVDTAPGWTAAEPETNDDPPAQAMVSWPTGCVWACEYARPYLEQVVPAPCLVWREPCRFPLRAWPYRCWERGFVVGTRGPRVRASEGPRGLPGRAGRPSLPCRARWP